MDAKKIPKKLLEEKLFSPAGKSYRYHPIKQAKSALSALDF